MKAKSEGVAGKSTQHVDEPSIDKDSSDVNSGPARWRVHLALVAVQCAFGGGSIVGHLGLADGTNPVFFALLREGIAAPILLTAALVTTNKWEAKAEDWWRFILTGFALFSNQLFFIIGLKSANAVTAAVWQLSQPMFALIIGLIFGFESATVIKILGILIAAAGAAFVVLYDQDNEEGLSGSIGGNICFILNCLGTALYVIWSKPLIKKYASITVTAVSYVGAAIMMAVAAVSINSSDQALKFVCPEGCDAWGVPANAVWALAYWIIFNSCIAYGLMTWANQYAEPSIVCAYTAFQPITAAVLASILYAFHVPNMSPPGTNDLGALGIFFGLGLIIFEDSREKEDNLLMEETASINTPLMND